VAVVVIGRNEGERLRESLMSVVGRGMPVVYVDSGSTDGSAGLARSLGCRTVELDSVRPFSAARARNEGLAEVASLAPEAVYVQLLDGDSRLCEGWPARAAEILDAAPEACSLSGRLREAHPERSIYNRVCEIEWNLPAGEVHCFGGIVFARVAALRASGGFDDSLVAGEEPELSQRLRRQGWKLLQVTDPMAVHDAQLLRFGAWWKRTYRSGHAYAQVCSMGTGLRIRTRFGLRQSLRVWFWAFVVPLAATAAALLQPLAGLAVLALYPIQVVRVAIGVLRQGHGPKIAAFYAGTWLPSMFAQWLGQCRFLLGRLTRRRTGLIEYKGRPGSVETGDRS
jgi:glycosyltransferase involved in cell wall biosynthesis